jgi:hypothetical protein
MYYSDKLTRGFIEAGTYIPWLDGGMSMNKWRNYDDPTYLGFSLKFVTFPVDFGADGVGEDYYPQGLLIEDKGDVMPYADSAQAYFRRRGEYYRAQMMKEFCEGIKTLQEDTPWVFQSIKGLSDMWKVDPTKPWRTKDKFITITCSESISLRITYLLDLYRKAMWDSAYHRWTTPDMQRNFGIEIVISEVRTMQEWSGKREDPAQEEGGLLQALQGIPAANALLNSAAGRAAGDLVDFFTKKRGPEGYASVWNTTTYMRFYLDLCELDPFSVSPAFLDASSYSDGKPIEVELKIKVGRAREFNVYGLLGAILTDTYSEYSRGKEITEKSFVGYSTDANKSEVAKWGNDLFARKGLDIGQDFSSVDALRRGNQQRRKFSPIGLVNKNSLPVGGGGPTTGTPVNPLIPASFVGSIPGPLQGIVNGVVAQGAALAGKLADSALGAIGLGKQDRLGNVYDLNPGSVANVLGVLKDPAAAAQNFLSAQASNLSDKIGAKNIGSVALGGNGPGIGEVAAALSEISPSMLIDKDGVIGAASFLTDAAATQPELTDKFLGSVQLLAQQVAGTPLENQSISFIMNAIASGNLQGNAENVVLEGAPIIGEGGGRVDLQAPSILNTTLGKILLDGSDLSQIEGTTGKVVLSAAYAAPQEPDLGKEPLTGKRVKKTMSDESVSLSAPSKNEIEGGNVGLEGPDAAIDSGVSPPKVPLESPDSLAPKLGNVGLEGDPSTPSKNLGNADLK